MGVGDNSERARVQETERKKGERKRKRENECQMLEFENMRNERN